MRTGMRPTPISSPSTASPSSMDHGLVIPIRPKRLRIVICRIVNDSGRRPAGTVELGGATLDSSDAVRRETLGLHRHRGDLGGRYDAVVAVGRPLDGLARVALLRRSCARHRRRSHPAIAPGLPRPQQVAARLAALMRTAVVGVGYLGRFHAQKYASLPDSHLVGVADPSAKARSSVAAELGVAAYADYRELLGHVDAVSIVTPTPMHFEVARNFLDAGASVLVEKPMTVTVAEAESLIELARRANRVLQVGHLERFNAAVQAVQPTLAVPRFIESARLAPFKHRGTDVDVVLDLMIHDIDLILSIVRSPVVAVDAIGSSVFSREGDIANARLRFANGCVANATASRVSMKTERKLRLFQDDAYISVDLHQKVLTVIRKGGVGADGVPQVAIEENTYEQGDALKDEIAAFLESAATGSAPAVSGEDGLLALRTAVSIAEQVANSRRRFS